MYSQKSCLIKFNVDDVITHHHQAIARVSLATWTEDQLRTFFDLLGGKSAVVMKRKEKREERKEKREGEKRERKEGRKERKEEKGKERTNEKIEKKESKAVPLLKSLTYNFFLFFFSFFLFQPLKTICLFAASSFEADMLLQSQIIKSERVRLTKRRRKPTNKIS